MLALKGFLENKDDEDDGVSSKEGGKGQEVKEKEEEEVRDIFQSGFDPGEEDGDKCNSREASSPDSQRFGRTPLLSGCTMS